MHCQDCFSAHAGWRIDGLNVCSICYEFRSLLIDVANNTTQRVSRSQYERMENIARRYRRVIAAPKMEKVMAEKRTIHQAASFAI